MDKAKIESIKGSFTPEQQEVYDTLMGDINKIRSEWFLCKTMYAKAEKVINDKNTGPEVRLLLRKCSTDYWSRRRLAMERTLEELGFNSYLVEWRAEYNA